MTCELETAVSRVLELAVHLSGSAEVAASDAATVAKDAALQHTIFNGRQTSKFVVNKTEFAFLLAATSETTTEPKKCNKELS